MRHNFGLRFLCTLLSAGMLMSLLPMSATAAGPADDLNSRQSSPMDAVEKDFSSADGFHAVESRAKNATMTLSMGGGVLNISGRQTADGHAWNYQTMYTGLNIPVREDTKLTYMMSPLGDMKDDYPSLHLAVDLKFSDGTYLSQLGVEDENRVGMNPDDQGEAKAMFYGVQNVSITALGAYEQCLGKTITDILVGYENKDGQAGGTFAATIDDLRIGPSVKVYDELTDYVVTTRGTNPVSPYELSRGACHPFVALPHGFNFWTPENVGWMGIYDYNAGYISSFRCSHQANFHLGDPAAWNFMVTSGGSGDTAYDHEDEVAQAHYYSVEFNKESGLAAGTKVEMSPTDHGVSVRATYDAGVALRGITVNSMKIDAASGSFSGTVRVSCTNGSWNTTIQKMYIYGTFDTPVENVKGNTAYFAEAASGQTVVTMNLATSFISVDQAKSNYEQELGGKTFDEVYTEAQAIWEDKLGVVEIEGATEDQLISFYSNMYRLFLYPNHMGEYTGEGTEGGWQYRSPYTQEVVDGKMYYNNGFWDTYRTAWPAYALLEPSQDSEMLNGFLYHYRDCDWIPRWSMPNGLDCMAGTSSDVVFGDALMRGVEFDVETAYEAALKNANMSTYAGGMGGRKGMDTGIFLGYIPNTTSNGMSWTLDGCLNDLGIAQMAKAVGDNDGYTYLMNRALAYTYLFDTESEWFRGRTVDGAWSVKNLNPTAFGGDYEETNAWNMAFSAPHDGQGLVNLYGSREDLATKLDAFFTTPYPSTTGMGGPTMINEIVQVKMGNYQHNNEPSLHIPYMYLYAGRPDRTQETVRQVLRQCYTGSQIGGGYIGDDDNGAQAAWYIFSAMGMYPLNVGSGELVFGSPLFTEVTIHLENGKDLVISAPDNSSQNIYVAGLTINGKPYNKTSILQTELTENGAVIEFEMTDKPSAWGTDPDAAPTSLTTNDEIPNPKADQTVEAICDGAENVSLLTDNSSVTGTTLTPVDGKVSVLYSFADMQCITMYTLTSAQDKTLAPRDFALYGSNDGKNWTLLDKREDVTFKWETYTRPFVVSNVDYYAEYRLDILTEHDVTLAEIELLANNQEEINRDTLLGAIAHAEARDTMGLTEAEKTQVKNAIAAAKAVADDGMASNETIQEAYAQLAKEIGKAFYRVSTKAELQKLYDTWASASRSFWSNETWADLQTALTKAKGLLDSETATLQDCENAEAAIQKAVAALAVGYDTSLSYGKEATASHSQPGEGASNALDGNPSTKWCSTSPQRGAYWLEVDLGETYRVDGWVVMGAANEPGGTGYLSSEYSLQTKDEDGKWITVMTANPENENVFTARLEEGAVGRYFRLYVPNPACPLDGYVRIYEFHVYGEVYVPEPETEPETEPVTEPVTEPETETEPEPDSVTEPEPETDPEEVTNPVTSPDTVESDSATEGETDAPKQGCSSSVGLNAVGALASLAVALASKKKRSSDVGEN